MKNALITYHSKTGTTKKFGFAIRDYLKELGIESRAIPIQNYSEEDLKTADYLFLGCWTNGLFVLLQHPDKEWIEFAKKLPALNDKKTALFTTYKLFAGSMFRAMRKHLKIPQSGFGLNLKSRNTNLSKINKNKIKEFVL